MNVDQDTSHRTLGHFALAVLSLVPVALFVLWAESNPASLGAQSVEDGPIENWTAVLFGLAAVCFAVFVCRSTHLRRKKTLYLLPIGLMLMTAVFFGEEISWGQRIFDIETPAGLKEINVQQETNLHNLDFVVSVLNKKNRLLDVIMFTIGVLLPVFAISRFGRRTIRRLAIPVAPLCYGLLFVGALLFHLYYVRLLPINASDEVKEFLLAAGMFAFALHGALSPSTLFRLAEIGARVPERFSGVAGAKNV